MMFSPKTVFLSMVIFFGCITHGHDSNNDMDFIEFCVDSAEDNNNEIDEGKTVTYEITITEGDIERYLIRSSNDFVFEANVIDREDEIVEINQTFSVNITGKFVGIEALEFVDPTTGQVRGTCPVRIKRVPGFLNAFFTYAILVWLVISYITMGALLEWSVLKQRIFPPWYLLIGMLCQFIIMPLLTFALANILPVDQSTAVGIVLIGTCPGGWLSNIFSILLDVDFILSLTMTFFSSVIAMAMMPFNIWLYATPFIGDNKNLQTPFKDLILNLLLLIVACVIGALLGRKFEKFRVFCEKILKPVAGVLIFVALVLGVPAEIYIFYAEWPVWVAAICTPAVGAYLGLSLARIFAFPLKTSATIALETGIQNALLARTVVILFYPQPEGDLIARVQTLTAVVTLAEGTILSLGNYLVRQAILRSKPVDESEQVVLQGMTSNITATTNGKVIDGVEEGGIDNPNFDPKRVV